MLVRKVIKGFNIIEALDLSKLAVSKLAKVIRENDRIVVLSPLEDENGELVKNELGQIKRFRVLDVSFYKGDSLVEWNNRAISLSL